MAFLLDTCAISEFVAPRPEPGAIEKMLDLPREELWLSVITIGELQQGIAEMKACKRKTFLEDWLDRHVLPLYADRTLVFDVTEARQWGLLGASLNGSGKKMPIEDSFLAATALTHDLTVVTRNEDDFRHTGVRIFNPWR
jgi:predicted nucleic acid-binding protein